MEEQDFDIRGILSLLRRRLRLILATLIACLGLAGIVTLALTPIYSASALVLVDPSRRALVDPEMAATSAGAESARVDSEVEIMRSQNVLTDVIRSQNLIADDEFGPRLGLRDRVLAFLRIAEADLPSGEAALGRTVNALRSAIAVQRRGLTNLISVQVQSEDPQKAATLANAVAQTYIEDQVRSKIEGVLAAGQVLNARVATARENLVSSEERFDTFIASNIDQLAAEPGSSVAALRASLENVVGAQEEIRSLSEKVDTALQERDWASLVAELESQALAELEAQRQELAETLSDTSAGSPAEVNLRAELARIEEALAQQASQDLENLQSQLTGLEAEAGSLRQQIRSDVLASDLPVEVLTQLYEIQQSADQARSQYQTLLARTSDLRVQAELQIADSRIVSLALPPTGPSFPNTRLILLLAGLAGLGLGVGLAFVYENFVGGFTSESQLGLVTRLPVVGDIPLQRLTGDSESAADMLVTAPLSQYSEAIRRTRAGVDQHLRQVRASRGAVGGAKDKPSDKGMVVMVSSSVPEEGKTTVALSLARAYAQSGKKTVIVDCDLRRPAIHTNLGIEPEVGLFEYLAGRTEAETLGSIILREEDTGLSVVVGSKRSDIPTDQLITSSAFERLIAAAVRNFEVVILDTPPVLPVVDGLYLSQYADAILFVVRWSSTAQAELRNALSRLEQAKNPGAPVLTVLNQQVRGQFRYGKGYDGYYTK